MRIAFGLALAGASILVAGCSLFHHHHAPPQPASSPAPPVLMQQSAPPASPQTAAPAQPEIKADLRSAGQIVKVNTEARFVVISFEAGNVPAAGQRLNIYRAGQKVGEVTVTGPQQENNTVADILTGDIQPHDQARAD